jgi:hypothetical protein
VSTLFLENFVKTFPPPAGGISLKKRGYKTQQNENNICVKRFSSFIKKLPWTYGAHTLIMKAWKSNIEFFSTIIISSPLFFFISTLVWHVHKKSGLHALKDKLLLSSINAQLKNEITRK